MKRFSLFMVVVVLTLVGCSTDDSLTESSKKNGEFILKSGVKESEYAAAIFGEIASEYLYRYEISENSLELVAERVLAIAKSNPGFMSLEGSEYVFIDEGDISKSITYTESYVSDLPFGNIAAQKVKAFITQEVDPLSDTSALVQEFSNQISVNYEIAQQEKDLILMCSGFLFDDGVDRGKDGSWGKTREVFATSLSGGFESPAQAVFNAAVVSALSL